MNLSQLCYDRFIRKVTPNDLLIFSDKARLQMVLPEYTFPRFLEKLASYACSIPGFLKNQVVITILRYSDKGWSYRSSKLYREPENGRRRYASSKNGTAPRRRPGLRKGQVKGGLAKTEFSQYYGLY